MGTSVSIDLTNIVGEVPRIAYGHFTEHLVHIVYGGLWAEHLYGRKFETPMAHRRRHTMAMPWEPFAGRGDHTAYLRAPMPLGRYASPHAGAHHSQGVVVSAGSDGQERGIAQPEIAIDKGTDYRVRARVRRSGRVGLLRVALQASDGETLLGEATVDIPPISNSRFGPDASYSQLWMDDLSYTEMECSLTAVESDPDGWFTLTFEPSPDEMTAFWFDWASLAPASAVTAGGWHPRVVEELRSLPVHLLKWPGGCMADDYDWRLGVGPRDTRFGSVDQAWAAWDDNDVGTDEFISLCRLTNAEPVIGVNAGTGTPELAAAWVEYCNGSAESGWGKVRAANGHSEPHAVRYWVVGNEQWGFFERGFVGAELYAERYLAIAEAMRAIDPNIAIVAVGREGDFNRTVLAAAAPMIDMLQIHHYTSETEADITDAEAASRKVTSASDFDRLFASLRDDIASLPEAEHVRVCLDEWGWGRTGHAGALFMAGVLNAVHRAAPLVQIGARATVMNVDGVLEREGEVVNRTPAYEVFRLFGLGHRPLSSTVEVTGGEHVDASCLVEREAGEGCTIYLVNRGPAEERVTLQVPGIADDSVVTINTVVAGGEGFGGPSESTERTATWTPSIDLAPISLTMIRTTPTAR